MPDRKRHVAQSFDETAAVADDTTASAATEDQNLDTQQQDTPRDPTDAEMYPNDEREPDDGADGGDDQDPEVNDDLPEIKAPNSLKAEEKEAFAKLPREAQEFVARRVTEVDRFAEAKAREAQGARQAAEREAIAQVQRIAQDHAATLEQFLPPVYQRPSYQLQIDDPIAFAEQMDAHEQSLAQREQAQQRIIQARQQAQHAEQLLRAQSQQEFHARLSQEYPEFLDEETGPKLRQQLGSIALELGFPAEVLPEADAQEVLAIRKASEWKAKADRWDALQKDKMAGVRAAKNLPKLAKPGAAGTTARAASVPIERELYPND